MNRSDSSFSFSQNAISFLTRVQDAFQGASKFESSVPDVLPQAGMGEAAALDMLTPLVLGGASDLGSETFFSHMNPPTPWVTWVATFWNAALNQNLLHKDTSPIASKAEKQIMDWLAPEYGANGGLLVPGATLANLTALWAARDLRGVEEIVASEDAHLSIRKSAHLLGMAYREVPVDAERRLDATRAGDLSRAALVLTAGTTNTGAIDPIGENWNAAWLHVDAAWSGPLQLTTQYKHLLRGIERADSVTVSAHKWFFQPKESALVFFQDYGAAQKALSFDGPYLADANVGLLGSHGATAIPLLATLLAWGREGLEQRLHVCMKASEDFAALVAANNDLELYAQPKTGIVLWRPKEFSVQELLLQLPEISVSTITIGETEWFRCVSANPMLNVAKLFELIQSAIAVLKQK